LCGARRACAYNVLSNKVQSGLACAGSVHVRAYAIRVCNTMPTIRSYSFFALSMSCLDRMKQPQSATVSFRYRLAVVPAQVCSNFAWPTSCLVVSCQSRLINPGPCLFNCCCPRCGSRVCVLRQAWRSRGGRFTPPARGIRLNSPVRHRSHCNIPATVRAYVRCRQVRVSAPGR